MSISGALNNALSGLTAVSRAANTVSNNIANAMTEGYGRRTVELASNNTGSHGGVRVTGILRHVNQSALADRRMADAEQNHASQVADFRTRFEALIGNPEDDYSLSALISNFENALISAGSRPDSNERLQIVAGRAEDLTKKINSLSDGVQKMREEADRKIDEHVGNLNAYLQEVRDLNLRIAAGTTAHSDTATLLDQRQIIVDKIAELVPIREIPRDHDMVALYTPGGAVLLDGTPAELEFTPANIIQPHMTEAAGMLSGLTINGVPVRTDSQNSPIRGGLIGAQFEIRDEIAVEAQAQVDSVARDLIERFQDPAVDPTLGATDAGLFTDEGNFFDPANEVGLSGRIVLNPRVDPDEGGELYRIRDGIGAAAPGPVGNADGILAMAAAMTTTRVPSSGGFGTAARSASDLTARFMSQVANAREHDEQSLSFATTRLTALNDIVLGDGVDTDQEMQRLLLIEQSYSANAKVVETVENLLDTLMRI